MFSKNKRKKILRDIKINARMNEAQVIVDGFINGWDSRFGQFSPEEIEEISDQKGCKPREVVEVDGLLFDAILEVLKKGGVEKTNFDPTDFRSFELAKTELEECCSVFVLLNEEGAMIRFFVFTDSQIWDIYNPYDPDDDHIYNEYDFEDEDGVLVDQEED